jgi:pathogenesis-related protein 1
MRTVRASLVSFSALLMAACSTAQAVPPRTQDTAQTAPPPARDEFAAAILAEHNRVRASVRPAPRTALPPLVWDESLAALAREWADRCPRGHRPRNRFGENIYWSGGTPATPEGAVRSWAEESANYDYESTVCTEDGRRNWAACGHYTQIVWRDTARVGCARKTACAGPFENVVVCNYDPPGNMNVSDTSIPRPY